MKLIIKKEIIVSSLENVTKALSTRNIIPVLNGIKFELKKSGLYLTSSDNDISIEIFINKKDIISIDEEGIIVISKGRLLLDLLKDLPIESEISIENFDENEITFKSNNFIYKSNCFPSNDFPNIKFEENENLIKLDAIKFKDIISKTVFACSNQESRRLLTGVNIKLVGDIFECVATDSYRLSKIQLNMEKSNNNPFNIVIPSRNISELYKILNYDSELKIYISNTKVLFEYENIKFQSSLLNGTYPNTDNSIPKEFKNSLKVNIKEVLSVVNSASKISDSKDKNIIEMEINKDLLIIKASSQESGKFEQSINIDNLSNNAIKISYSARYMIDALKVFDCENIILLMNGEISPIIIKEEGKAAVTELILPMKTF